VKTKAAYQIPARLNMPQSNMPKMIILGLSMLVAISACAQTDNAPPQQPVPAMVGLDNSANPASNSVADNSSSDRMMTPPPVSGQTYPTAFTSEERANYLRGGLSFTSVYFDNALGAVNGHPVSDISYSVAPTVALDETTPRTKLSLIYAPGFTFYQRTSSLNEADQNASIVFAYRVSPHVTFSASDTFQKSSNVFNQPPDLASIGVVSGGVQDANFSIIPPTADRLSNLGGVGLTYQFSLNDMVGVGGTFSNLHYTNPAQVPGLFDSSSQSGLAFYSHRLTKTQYFGVTYSYQRLLSFPTGAANETQTHAALFFYTFYPTPHFSMSFFGGPQYSDTVQPPLPPLVPQLLEVKTWTPAAGASLGWQGRLNSFALSYSYIIAGGGGLIGAVQSDSATASARQQITRTLSLFLTGAYGQQDYLGSPLLSAGNGHSVSGSATLRQQVGQHLSIQLGYTRLHQDYSEVAVISTVPDTNRESISISYQFSRGLGR